MFELAACLESFGPPLQLMEGPGTCAFGTDILGLLEAERHDFPAIRAAILNDDG